MSPEVDISLRSIWPIGGRGLLVANIGLLRAVVRRVRQQHPFVIEAIVVLPDHLHTVWTLPDGDCDFSTRWGLIEAGFSRGLARGEPISASRARKSERGIWQRRFWEHTIRGDDDFARHVDYIHFNPVKHGHAARVGAWPFSSFRRMVRPGVYPEDWASGSDDDRDGFGERPASSS